MGTVYGVGRRRIIWIVAGVLFAAITVWVHYEVKVKMAPMAELTGGGTVEQSGNLTVGEEIPDFSAIDLNGSQVTLSDFRDREVVVLDFWATWCGPCIQSMPALEDLNDRFDERGATILAVNVGENPDLVRDFVDDMEFAVRVVMDEDEEISGAYGVRGIPQLVIVGVDGRVEHIEVGYPPFRGLAEQRNKRLQALLEDLTQDNEAIFVPIEESIFAPGEES